MSENKHDSAESLLDPADDAPEWTEEMFEVAELAIRGKVVRPATGYLGPDGVVRGRPPLREHAKRQVTLRLDPDVIERFRADGPGWQGRMNAALRKAAGL
ncbi:BrnA antitoxin family protein [Sphingomonas melonis]